MVTFKKKVVTTRLGDEADYSHFSQLVKWEKEQIFHVPPRLTPT